MANECAALPGAPRLRFRYPLRMLQPADLIAYVRAVHDRTYEAVALLDDSTVEWRPREGEFICGEATRYEGHELPPLAGWNFVRRLAEHSSVEALRKLEAADLSAEVTTMSGTRVPAWRLLVGGLIEHEVHHRSQLCEYLSMMGIPPPPLYGLHVEDLRRG